MRDEAKDLCRRQESSPRGVGVYSFRKLLLRLIDKEHDDPQMRHHLQEHKVILGVEGGTNGRAMHLMKGGHCQAHH